MIQTVVGGSGDDTINGNAYNNVLLGGPGNDLITGGLGADRFVLGAPSNGADTFLGERGVDELLERGLELFARGINPPQAKSAVAQVNRPAIHQGHQPGEISIGNSAPTTSRSEMRVSALPR